MLGWEKLSKLTMCALWESKYNCDLTAMKPCHYFIFLFIFFCSCGGSTVDKGPSGKYKVQAQFLVKSSGGYDYQEKITKNLGYPTGEIKEWCARVVSDRMIKQAAIKSNLDTTKIHEIRKQLLASNVDQTSIVSLEYYCEDSDLGVAFINHLMDVVIEEERHEKIIANEQSLAFIEMQLDSANRNLNHFEEEIQAFKSTNQILDLDKESGHYFEMVVTLQNELRMAQIKRESIELIADDLKNSSLKESYFTNTDEFLNTKIRECFDLKSSVTDQTNQMKKVKGELSSYLNNVLQSVQMKISDIESRIMSFESELMRVPEKQRGMLEIKRQAEVANKLYLFLMEKRANTAIARAGIVGEIMVIEAAHVSAQ